ncbi:MAG: patatin-like phospholipase family protein [Myxococcaceae bacterium]
MTAPTLASLLEGRRFGLVMSAGFFGFYGHAGFLEGLLRSGLQPSAYAGSSAGGLIAAHAAAGASLDTLQKVLLELNREHFWDPDPIGALVGAVRGGHGSTGLLKGDRFRVLLKSSLPVDSFEACPKPLVLVATNLTRARSEIFSSGDLLGPVHATCAYPGLFRAVPVRDELFWDGGIIDKAPLVALAESEAGRDLDAFLVHWLPSRSRQKLAGAFAYAQGMGVGLDAARREHFALQLKVLEARGIPVYVVVSHLPAVSPSKLSQGRQAMEAARAATGRALSKAPEPFPSR